MNAQDQIGGVTGLARRFLGSVLVFVLAALGLACGASGPEAQGVGLANPASVHCAKVGGDLRIEKNAAGAEYGVCVFEDNRQCEEWALFRGDCPQDGLKVTGYVTPGSRYCVIRGGAYRVTDPAIGQKPELGMCTLPGGKRCSAESLYAGTCS